MFLLDGMSLLEALLGFKYSLGLLIELLVLDTEGRNRNLPLVSSPCCSSVKEDTSLIDVELAAHDLGNKLQSKKYPMLQ
jgi:hypothetical protein